MRGLKEEFFKVVIPIILTIILNHYPPKIVNYIDSLLSNFSLLKDTETINKINIALIYLVASVALRYLWWNVNVLRENFHPIRSVYRTDFRLIMVVYLLVVFTDFLVSKGLYSLTISDLQSKTQQMENSISDLDAFRNLDRLRRDGHLVNCARSNLVQIIQNTQEAREKLAKLLIMQVDYERRGQYEDGLHTTIAEARTDTMGKQGAYAQNISEISQLAHNDFSGRELGAATSSLVPLPNTIVADVVLDNNGAPTIPQKYDVMTQQVASDVQFIKNLYESHIRGLQNKLGYGDFPWIQQVTSPCQ